MTDRQIEMHWYCGTCHRDNRGRDDTCSNCGKPHEAEEYLMPSDTRSAPSVTDPALLRKATAGPNWRCLFCQSSQRRTDGCCARCGAPPPLLVSHTEVTDPFASSPPVTASVPPEAADDAITTPREIFASHRALVLGIAACLSLALVIWWFCFPHAVRVNVTAVSWEQSIEIERYRVTGESGWIAAGDGFNVKDEGARVHHYDHRPVGNHLENYTVEVACGQTCTPIPRSCSESCTSNKNGFATCRTSCSGGGESCSTRYCAETRYRTVTDYQDFPIYQDWYSWQAWRWLHQRDARATGITTETHWPSSEEEHLGEGLLDREREREGARHASYHVTFAHGDDKWQTDPKTEAEFRKRALGSHWQISVNRLGMVSEERPE